METRLAEAHWRKAHDAAWVQAYAASINGPHRRTLQEALRLVAPFRTAVDLGCNCGVLMPLLQAVSPDVQVTGLDVNALAIREAKNRWPAHTWALMSVADWLPMMAGVGRTWELVVSSSCLEHVAPSDIALTLQSMAKLATRAIVLQEVTVTPQRPEGTSWSCGVPEWRHDYERRLQALGWQLVAKCWQDVTTERPGAVLVFTPERT